MEEYPMSRHKGADPKDQTPTPKQTESFDNMQKRTNPVETKGTTEVPVLDPVASQPNDAMQQRYEDLERQKEKDIKKLEKESDGKPKV